MIYVVGSGPGLIEHLSLKAIEVIKSCDVIVGYKTYMKQISELIKDKEVFVTGMRGEVERCNKALAFATKGKTVALISGGESGIYGMAGLMNEIVVDSGKEINVTVIPGITASSAGAASLGAPLMHDFVTISLSDLLTDWELIKKRLHCAGEGDFVVAIYNPKSKGRPTHIKSAQEILLSYKSKSVPVGIVKNAKRNNEQVIITNLAEMCNEDIDMSSIVIVGNSKTYVKNGKMITPRGYSY